MDAIRRILLAWSILLGGALVSSPAEAQSWPAKPVKIVVPTSPGGATDALARALAARLGDAWHQIVLVEDRPGANQIIGGEYVAKAAPDGYTLIVSDASTYVINPLLYKHLNYDPLTAFAPITMLVQVPWVVAVNASLPVHSMQELFDYARAKPGVLSYGSFGSGSSVNICMDYLKQLVHVDITHVPFKGSAPALNALLAGDISMMMVTPQIVEPHVRTGKLRLLAAATPQRIPLLPDLPTIAETAVPGYSAGTWFGMLGPAGIPADVVAKISADVGAIMSDPRFREEHLSGLWLIPAADTPREFAEYIKTDSEHWKKLVTESGVTVD
jgi:tripartite-type tricarboxylate transporter receptor subunit TctC